MYPNSMLIGGIIAAIFAATVLFGTLLAIKRGFFPALIRLALIVASLILALITAPMIATKLTALSENFIYSMFGSVMDQIAQYSPSTMELLHQLPIALLSPALFIAIFFLLKTISLIIFRILKAALPSRSSILFRLLGGVTGAVASLICLCVVFLPLWGAVGVFHRTAVSLSLADTSEKPGLTETIDQLEALDQAIIGPIVDNPMANIFTESGDNILFRTLTKFKMNEDQLQLGDEIDLLAQTASDALTFVGTMPEDFALGALSDTQFTSLHTLTADIDHSTLLRNIFAEWISSVTGTWENGEEFMGMPEPVTNPSIQPVVRTFYAFLASTNADCLADDFDAVIDLFALFVEHGLLDEEQQDNLLSLFGDHGFAEDLIALLAEEDRIRTTLADFLSSLMTAWKKGESYQGLPVPRTNELVEPIMDEFFHVFATTDETLIVSDMTALADIIGVLKDYDIFNSVQNGKDMAKIVMNGQFIADLNAAVNNNERFTSLMNAVTSIGLSAISSQLNVSLPDSAMMKDLSLIISQSLSGSQDQAALTASINQTLKSNQVDVPESISATIAQVSLAQFENTQNVSEQAVSDYLTGIYGATDNLDSFFQ